MLRTELERIVASLALDGPAACYSGATGEGYRWVRPVSTLRPRAIQYEAVRVLRVSPPHDIGRHHDRRQSHECDQHDYDVTRARGDSARRDIGAGARR